MASPVEITPGPYEPVYTCFNWHDGERVGIAAFRGVPHLFQCQWDDRTDGWDNTFLLMPLSPEVVRLALERWEIWLRWDAAYKAGKTTVDTHPALPEDRARREQLERLLAGKLVADPARSIRAYAEFRPCQHAEDRASRFSNVRWIPLAP